MYDGSEITLSAGQPGLMEDDKAKDAVEKGDAQVMAGETPDSLKKPEYGKRALTASAKPSRRRNKYNRRDMTAEDS